MAEKSPLGIEKHHYHSARNRAAYCFLLAGFVLLFGTLGVHWIEGFSYVDSFYFTSMIATGQGPAPSLSPATSAGKLFTCLLAFISVGSMAVTLGFLFGPFLGKLLKIGAHKLEDELHTLNKLKPPKHGRP